MESDNAEFTGSVRDPVDPLMQLTPSPALLAALPLRSGRDHAELSQESYHVVIVSVTTELMPFDLTDASSPYRDSPTSGA